LADFKLNQLIVDYIIVGQGIAGALLSYELYKAGKQFVVIDNANPKSASLTAAAILNPLAGKHWRLSPDASSTMDKAVNTYRGLEDLLQIKVLHNRPLCIFFKSEEERKSFEDQAAIASQHLSVRKENANSHFSFENGMGRVDNVCQIDAINLLQSWRHFLVQRQAYLQEAFDLQELLFDDDSIRYKGISARKIIFCQGANAINNPFTNHLPFTSNRGEALLLRIPDLSDEFVYHHEYRLAPFRENLFWLGSNYKWQFDDMNPDKLWRDAALSSLKNWLKLPFEFVEHLVAERPTTAGQKVFAELHPDNKCVGYFNGLGTRGFSAGPKWAHKMLQTLLSEK